MGLETSDVEEVAKELGIPLSAKHLTQLATEDVTKLRSALQGGRRASKDTRVDSTIVRRRKRGEEDKAAPAVSAQAASVQVAGGAGSVATSPTTVRRKRVEKPELEEAVEVRP
ncbi:MAG TPA: hypothetical protein PK095_18095, partial [Myxococcota bacterium]|nr:hypothetical protein [Myxococcota bacterium]